LLRGHMASNPAVGSSRTGSGAPGGSAGTKRQKGKTPGSGDLADNSAAPPVWAMGLMASIENLNSRLGLLETGQHRPSYLQAAGGSPAPSLSGGISIRERPASPATPPQPAPRQPQKPPKGESGSGFTRIPNGKLVRNKRPVAKPLPVRQAKNWRQKATTNLVEGLKTLGIGPADPKPVNDEGYRDAVIDLTWSKAYYAYVRTSDNPLEVGPWRASNPVPTWDEIAAGDTDAESDGDEGPEEPPQSPTEAPRSPNRPARLASSNAAKAAVHGADASVPPAPPAGIPAMSGRKKQPVLPTTA